MTNRRPPESPPPHDPHSLQATWYRGGAPKTTKPNWWTKSRAYAGFYGDEIYELGALGEILDLSKMGVDIDADTLAADGLPTPHTSSGEMYEWGEKCWRELRSAGYAGVIVKQWHANFGDTAYTSLLYWGAL